MKILGGAMKNFLKIFDSTNDMPISISKHQKLYEIILMIYSCIIMPAISAIVATRGEDRAIYKSLSYLAYTEGHMALIYLWGLSFFVGYFFALTLILYSGGFTKRWKIVFYSLAAISTIVIVTGLSVPWLHVEGELAPKYDRLRQIHNNLSTLGFIMVVVTTILLFLSTLFRNLRQGLISLGVMGYLFITSFVAIKEANIVPGPCPVSAIAQIYIFSIILFVMFLQYVFMRTIPIKKDTIKD
ncbi:MAG: hypothetical protein ACI4M5_03240 [Christensenellales bacterium]